MNIKGIDILEGLEHANNDEELYQEILQIYYEDSEDMLNQLRNNIQRTDMKLFITQAHAMKSSSRNIARGYRSSLKRWNLPEKIMIWIR